MLKLHSFNILDAKRETKILHSRIKILIIPLENGALTWKQIIRDNSLVTKNNPHNNITSHFNLNGGIKKAHTGIQIDRVHNQNGENVYEKLPLQHHHLQDSP